MLNNENDKFDFSPRRFFLVFVFDDCPLCPPITGRKKQKKFFRNKLIWLGRKSALEEFEKICICSKNQTISVPFSRLRGEFFALIPRCLISFFPCSLRRCLRRQKEVVRPADFNNKMGAFRVYVSGE